MDNKIQDNIDENDPIFNIKQKDYETEKQYKFRKNIYDNILEDTHSKKKATIFSNIWINILSLNATYPPEIMNLINKYKPNETIYQ